MRSSLRPRSAAAERADPRGDQIRLRALVRVGGLVAKRHKRLNWYGWRAIFHQTPDRIGLINLNGTIVARRPNRPWRACDAECRG